MPPFGHRLQILLDDERHRRITALARERGVSVATVVRDAIDRGLANLSHIFPDANGIISLLSGLE